MTEASLHTRPAIGQVAAGVPSAPRSETQGRRRCSTPAVADFLARTQVRHGTGPPVLRAIREALVDLALWTRTLPPALAQWLEHLPATQLPATRVLVTPAQAPVAVARACAAAHTPVGALRDALIDDVADLTQRFAALAGVELVDLRLEALDNDGCRRWHRDCVPLRLLTTYRGPGTEWVPPASARKALAAPDHYDGLAESLPAHAVAVFKGCAGEQPTGRGIVHRSPRIEGSGITRLLLCMNAPGAISPPPFVASASWTFPESSPPKAASTTC